MSIILLGKPKPLSRCQSGEKLWVLNLAKKTAKAVIAKDISIESLIARKYRLEIYKPILNTHLTLKAHLDKDNPNTVPTFHILVDPDAWSVVFVLEKALYILTTNIDRSIRDLGLTSKHVKSEQP